MSRWRRRPIVIEAWQFMPAGECEVLPSWIDPAWIREDTGTASDRSGDQRVRRHMIIPTRQGALRAELTDWIIRGIGGDVYPCKAEVFASGYDPE